MDSEFLLFFPNLKVLPRMFSYYFLPKKMWASCGSCAVQCIKEAIIREADHSRASYQ